MFFRESTAVHIFKACLGLVLFFYLMDLAFAVAIDETLRDGDRPLNENIRICIFETLFFIDMLISFLSVPTLMKKPTVKKTGLLYLQGYFFFDFLSTIVSNLLIFVPGTTAALWFIRLKLIRIVKRKYIRYAYKSIVNIATAQRPKVGKLIDFMISTAFECIFWVHILTCIWLKLGSIDSHEDRYLTMDQGEVSWMFIVGSDFSAD